MLGLIWGLVFGHCEQSLGVAVFFELFWLDHFPAGTVIPPNTTLSTLVALCLARYFRLEGPQELFAPVVFCVPLAFFGARLELMQRRIQDRGYNQLVRWSRRPDHHAARGPERLILTSLAQTAALNAAAFALFFCSLVWLFSYLPPADMAGFLGVPLTWGHLWFPAAMGGLLALRLKSAHAILGLGVAAMVIFRLMG